jgi:glucose/arabinose dehydrogenase
VGSSLPAGFRQTQLASGLNNPSVVAFSPNGDIWIGEQAGSIVIYHHGAILPKPAITIPRVYSQGETGVLGLAFDPKFATNGYIYVSYTANVTSHGVTTPLARLSRFTASGNTVDPASEKVFYQGNQAQNQHHAANTVKIGPDGKLWWSVGDNVPSISNAQALTNIYGKILRFNLDGSIPKGNPYMHVPDAVPAIWATGVRNVFRFTFLPNGRPMAENTGSPGVADAWEDLYLVRGGDNWGWPYYSGYCGSCGYVNPTYEYGHIPVDGAASAIAAYSGTAFPKAYNHTVFVGDYNIRGIQAINFDPTYHTATSATFFDTNAGTIADLEEGHDGNLYFVSIFEGTLSKISAPGPFPPTAKATATPDAGRAPLTVQFSSAGSSDPYGKPLTYAWKFGDGGTSTSANPSHVYAANGTYTATLTVSNGTHSGTATTRVTVGKSPSTASITAPATYDAGDTVSFSGTATDPVDGTLPGYDYRWKVDFYRNGVADPSYYAEVAVPFYGAAAGTSGKFTVPTDPYQVRGSFYRITLTVTDSRGLQTVVTKDLHPNLTSFTVTPNVPGAGYYVDGTWHTGTFTTQDVVGAKHVLTGMPLAQVIGGKRYRFHGWADGSALTDLFTSAATAGSYTASYEPVQTAIPSPWKSTDIGAPITAGTAGYAAGTKTFYVDGAGADEFTGNDQSHFVYQTMPGNGTIIARVRYQTNSDPWAKAGLMIRQSTTTGAHWVDALVTPDVSPNTPNINGIGCNAHGCLSPLPAVIPKVGNGVREQTYTGSESAGPTLPGYANPNKWLKLTRNGSIFTSFESTDGVHWTSIGSQTVPMTGTVDIGLFVTSHNIGEVSAVALDHVTITPGP